MTPKSSIADINQLIGDAKNAELYRDIKTLNNVLGVFWNDYDQLPVFGEYEPQIQADLFRLCSFFLTFYGRSQNLSKYQSRAKDLAIKALEIFDSQNLTVGAAEARITLSFCYWNSGEISEAISILDTVKAEFKDTNQVIFLRTQINKLLLLVWDSKLEEAYHSLETIRSEIELCNDLRLKAIFYSESAIIYRRLKHYNDAEFHYREAIRLASKAKNFRFTAVNFNNLAMFYRDRQEYKLSHLYARKALKIYTDLGDEGWIPHVLDTIALIYLDERKYAEALKTIEKAIEYFYKGEDTTGLLDAFWTKTKCFLSLGELEKALTVFGELQFVARSRIGDIAVNKYSKFLAKELYVLKNLSLPEEVSEFKKTLVGAALVEANGEIGKAAKLLKLKKHQALSEILEKQFPELRAELGFTRRARRTVSKKQEPIKKVAPERKIIRQESQIKRIILPDKKYSFDFHFRSATFEIYYFKKAQMKAFGLDSSAVVAVFPITELKIGTTVLVAVGKDFFVGKVEFDDFIKLYFIIDQFGSPIPIDDENLIGEPIGYCPIDKAKEEFINFSKIET